jgi:ribonuclease P/MRP protein subunit RPP20
MKKVFEKMEQQSKERIRQKNTQNQESNKRFASDNHVMKKRVPSKSFQRENDIYITNKTNFVVISIIFKIPSKSFNYYYPLSQAQLKKCEEILNSETGEVFLHSIGLAINRGINLALKLQQDSNGAIGVEANTSTIELVGELFVFLLVD